jgi:uncharacterized protein (TIRG00374 family)
MIQILLPLSLGMILLWYLYRNQDPGEIINVVRKGVRYDILLFSLVFGLAANTVRGLRWSMLIDSLGKRVDRKMAIYAVWGNYAINIALPRVGEIWRCGVMSKYEKIPFAKLLGTMIVDRVMDTLVVALLTVCLCVFNIGFFRDFFSENPPVIITTLYALISSVTTYIGLTVLAVALWFVFVKLKHLAIVKKIAGMFRNIWEGVKSLWKIEHMARFFVQTLLIWTGYFFYFYITFFAFDFTRDLGVRIALIAFAMSSIGVAIPVQGGIGVWHFMVISTLVAFGTDASDAGAFAMVVFAVQTAWVILTGLFGIAALPIAGKKRGKDEENTLHPGILDENREISNGE